jgi:hypothetical protein
MRGTGMADRLDFEIDVGLDPSHADKLCDVTGGRGFGSFSFEEVVISSKRPSRSLRSATSLRPWWTTIPSNSRFSVWDPQLAQHDADVVRPPRPYANESCSLMGSHREQARERSHKHAANCR